MTLVRTALASVVILRLGCSPVPPAEGDKASRGRFLSPSAERVHEPDRHGELGAAVRTPHEPAAIPALPQSGIELAPLERSPPTTRRGFRRLDATETGIDFAIHIDPQIWLNDYQSLLNGSLGGAVCVGDVDNDVLPDVFLAGREGANKLYRNLGDLRFEDVTSSAGLEDEDGVDVGASLVDVELQGLPTAVNNAAKVPVIGRSRLLLARQRTSDSSASRTRMRIARARLA